MTSPAYLTTARSSSTVGISGGPSTVTKRGTQLVAATAGGATFLSFPAGTVAGDTAVVIASSGWDWNGSPISSFEQRIEYIGGVGTPVSGWAFYFTVSSAQETAGGFTLNGDASMGVNGHIAMAVFAGAVSVSKLQSLRPSPTTATQIVTLGNTGENDTYLVYGAEEANSTVGFAVVPTTHTLATASFCSAFGILEAPGTRNIKETVTYGSTTPSSYTISLRVSNAPQNHGTAVASTAISSASVGNRYSGNALYYEAVVDTLAGIVGIGMCNVNHGHGASTLGANVNSFIYQSNGQVRCNNVTLATISNFVQGDRISVAYHPGAQLVWFKVNAGSWNNDGTANPATFTGGIDVSTFYTLMVMPAVSFSVTDAGVSFEFSAASFTYTPPSGYYSMEEVNVGPCRTEFTDWCPFLAGDQPSDWHAMTERPQDNYSRAISFPGGPIGVIAGKVMEDSIGVEGKRVLMYNRRTGDFVGEAFTDGSGNYLIPAQDPTLPHFVVAFDDPDYNAKVYDNVLPG